MAFKKKAKNGRRKYNRRPKLIVGDPIAPVRTFFNEGAVDVMSGVKRAGIKAASITLMERSTIGESTSEYSAVIQLAN